MNRLNTVAKFDEHQKWSMVGSLMQHRDSHRSLLVGESIFHIGGYVNHSQIGYDQIINP